MIKVDGDPIWNGPVEAKSRKTVTHPRKTVTPDSFKGGRGLRVHGSNAERQRAYRERKKAAG